MKIGDRLFVFKIIAMNMGGEKLSIQDVYD